MATDHRKRRCNRLESGLGRCRVSQRVDLCRCRFSLFRGTTPAGYYQGMSWPDRVVVDPQVLAGKPIVRGTRLAVEFILDLLAAGQSEADIVANYPGLAHEDVLACLAYASHLAHEYRAYPLPV